MSADRECLVCGDPMPPHENSPACDACWARLEKNLAQIPALVKDLEVMLARLDKVDQAPPRHRSAPEAEEHEPVARDIPPWLRAESQARIKARALPLRLEAGDQLLDLHAELLRVVGTVLASNPACQPRVIAGPTLPGQRWPITIPPRLPAPKPLSDTRAASRFLLSALPWLRSQPDQHPAIRTIDRAVKRARSTIDTAPGLDYCGVCSSRRPATTGCPGPDRCACGCHDGYGNPCTIPGGCGLITTDAPGTIECTEELYAVNHRSMGKDHLCTRCSHITCRTCGTVHDVKERRHALLEAARDYLVTTTEACQAVSTYSDGSLKEATIRKWKERSRLAARGHTTENGTRQDLFLLGDVIDLALASDTRKGA